MTLAQIPVPTSTLWSNNRTGIKEVLGANITGIMQSMDPFMRDIPITSAGVKKDDLGREYVINKLFYEGCVTGNFEPMHGVNRLDSFMYGEGLASAAGNYQKYAKPTKTMPTPFGGLLPKPFRLRTPMRGFLGNFPLALTMMDYDANNAVILKMVQKLIEGVALGASTQILNGFWNQDHKLGALGPNSGTGAYTVDNTAGTNTITFYPGHQAINRFVRGMQVDLWAYTGGVTTTPKRINTTLTTLATSLTSNCTEANRVRVWVKEVDPSLNKVVLAYENGTTDTSLLKSVDGTEAIATATRFAASGAVSTAATEGLGTADNESTDTDSVFITYANQWANETEDFKGLFGIHHVLKTSGNLYGGEAITGEDGAFGLGGAVSVADHPSMKSLQWDTVGQLTEHKLNLYFDRFFQAANMYNQDLDTFITTQGVLRSYQKNVEARMERVREGLSSLKQEGNTGDWTFAYKPGKTLTIKINDHIKKGRGYGLKLANNWEICVPPFMQNQGGQHTPNMPKWVPVDFFAGRLMGTGAAHMPYQITETGDAASEVKITEWIQFPFRAMLQFVASDQARGMLLTGITEEKVYADA